MKTPAITADDLRTALKYDPETGEFTWRQRDDVRPQWNGRFAGKRAGYACVMHGRPYWIVRFLDWPFPAHRLAWLYMTGEWPVDLVDHADNDGTNNRWANLRAATKAENGWNSRRPATNTSGFKGVSIHRPSGQWRATIRLNGRQAFLGHFSTPEDAHAAYAAAAQAHRGKFARLS